LSKTERKKIRENPEEARVQRDKRAVFIHGVPELKDAEETKNRQHDCQEWRYIQELLELNKVLTMDIRRLPKSSKYKGSGPRILKVLVQSEDMVTEVLKTWYQRRRTSPPELRMRSALLHTFNRQLSDTEDGVQISGTQILPSTTYITVQDTPKNDPQPTPPPSETAA
jgi:hypothetical protein